MNQRQRYGLIGGVLGTFIGGALLYASPYITLYQMYQALKHNDVQGVASHVNFPALRESVKMNLNAAAAQQITQPDNPILNLLGSALSGIVLDSVIDHVVTPEGVAALLEGQRLLLKGDRQPQFSEKAAAVAVQPYYESFNQFVVSVQPKGENTTPVDLILSREGLGWKVTGVRLPRL